MNQILFLKFIRFCFYDYMYLRKKLIEFVVFGNLIILDSLVGNEVLIETMSSGDCKLDTCYIQCANFKTQSSGNIECEGGTIHKAQFCSRSSGDIRFLSGTIDELEANVHSSGSIRLQNTTIQSFTANTFCSGDIECFIVVNKLDCETTSSGDIRGKISENCIVRKRKSSSGDITLKRIKLDQKSERAILQPIPAYEEPPPPYSA